VRQHLNDIITTGSSPPSIGTTSQKFWLDGIADRFIDLARFTPSTALESDHNKLTDALAMHREWPIAFAAAKHVIFYVYPHRSDELAEYEEFVIETFVASDSAEHRRVLDRDRAILARVVTDNKLCLSSFSEFDDLSTKS
jgi:hypothetical protein